MAAGGPDIAGLLASLGGGAPPDAGGAPPDAPPDAGGGAPDAAKALDLIQQIVDLAKQYLDAEPDQEDKLQGTKLLQLAQQLLAKDQQDRDQAMGGGNQRILRKAG